MEDRPCSEDDNYIPAEGDDPVSLHIASVNTIYYLFIFHISIFFFKIFNWMIIVLQCWCWLRHNNANQP